MSEELQSISDSFTDLERDRLRLEQSVSQLQRSLQHWQIWELEYEGFKEDLLGLNTDAELVQNDLTWPPPQLKLTRISDLRWSYIWWYCVKRKGYDAYASGRRNAMLRC